jgi:hypothetical protein
VEYTCHVEILSTDAEGWLSIYCDNYPVGLFDERFTPPGSNTFDLYLGELSPGLHTLAFQLEPYSLAQSRVHLSNLTLGRSLTPNANPVPEPGSLVLLALVLLLWLTHRYHPTKNG